MLRPTLLVLLACTLGLSGCGRAVDTAPTPPALGTAIDMHAEGGGQLTLSLGVSAGRKLLAFAEDVVRLEGTLSQNGTSLPFSLTVQNGEAAIGFSNLAPGNWTLTLTAYDRTGRAVNKPYETSFDIKAFTVLTTRLTVDLEENHMRTPTGGLQVGFSLGPPPSRDGQPEGGLPLLPSAQFQVTVLRQDDNQPVTPPLMIGPDGQLQVMDLQPGSYMIAIAPCDDNGLPLPDQTHLEGPFVVEPDHMLSTAVSLAAFEPAPEPQNAPSSSRRGRPSGGQDAQTEPALTPDASAPESPEDPGDSASTDEVEQASGPQTPVEEPQAEAPASDSEVITSSTPVNEPPSDAADQAQNSEEG